MATPFDLSDRLVDEMMDLDPLFASALGHTARAAEWGDQGVSGYSARHDLAQRYLREFRRHLDHPDRRERIAARVLAASLQERVDGHAFGDHLADLAHMATSFQRFVRIFDVMPKETAADWEAIVGRLATIDRAWAGLEERLEAGRASGLAVASRQVGSVIDQASRLADDAGTFGLLAASAPAACSDHVARAAAHAKTATASFAQYLATVYLPSARLDDGCGEAEYRRRSHRLVGAEVDPHEAYAWGWEEFHRLLTDITRVGAEIVAGGSLSQVTELLETDPDRAATSLEEFRDFIAARQALALDQLDGSHFDVAPQLRQVSVEFAPPGSPLGAFYVRPNEDFGRPGAIWYSVGDQTTFPLYHHVSTAYHEGFPGHHLQIGTAMVNADRISRAHRLAVWYPGYGEGWALYAERLMHELGFYEVPDYHFGMLAKHLYRATRIVVDIGLHLGLRIPDHAPLHAGEPWSFDCATAYLRRYGFRTAAQAEGEVLRYLGWPGQAISYKLGEREILHIRRQAQQRAGSSFDLKAFHDRVLGHGAMRFDLLAETVLEGIG